MRAIVCTLFVLGLIGVGAAAYAVGYRRGELEGGFARATIEHACQLMHALDTLEFLCSDDVNSAIFEQEYVVLHLTTPFYYNREKFDSVTKNIRVIDKSSDQLLAAIAQYANRAAAGGPMKEEIARLEKYASEGQEYTNFLNVVEEYGYMDRGR